MNSFKLFVFGSMILIFSGCSSSKNITQTMQDGQTAYAEGNYQKAFSDWEVVIEDYKNQGKANECPVYTEAAAAAMHLGQLEKAIQYLEAESNTANVEAITYYELAGLYRKIDNLSKELDELDTYVAKYPEGENIEQVQTRLFEIYLETDRWEDAIAKWNDLSPESQSGLQIIEGYFLANKKLKNDDVCDKFALLLLELDNENVMALDWFAKQLFWKAEKRYQDEMKAYNTNKTNKQYNRLLKALDVVSKDFKTSLGYFKTLYAIDPNPQYAKYLGDIYNRLDDKKKANYYYEKAKGSN